MVPQLDEAGRRKYGLIRVDSYCPLCGAGVPNRRGFGKPYECPNCKTQLQLSSRQGRIKGWADAVIAILAAWFLGFRGWGFAIAAVALFVGTLLVLTPLWIKLWPDRLESYKGGRIWG